MAQKPEYIYLLKSICWKYIKYGCSVTYIKTIDAFCEHAVEAVKS